MRRRLRAPRWMAGWWSPMAGAAELAACRRRRTRAARAGPHTGAREAVMLICGDPWVVAGGAVKLLVHHKCGG